MKVLFIGGTWDQQAKVVPDPPPREYTVPVRRSARNMVFAPSDPLPYPVFPCDRYRLEWYVDHTGIPSKAYRLREMVRD